MASSANEELLDALLRHQTYLLRYSSFVRNRVLKILDESEDALATLIRERLRAGTGLENPAAVRRMETLLAAIDKLRENAWEEASKLLESELQDLAAAEPVSLQGVVATVSPVVLETSLPSPRMLRAIVMTKPFEGRVMREWAQHMKSEDLRRIHAAVQLGMLAGESNNTIARRVVGTGTLLGTDGVTEMTRRQVTAVTRTAVQHVANSARDEFLRENADVMLAELYVATLDSRTTPVCRANDGKQFPVGTGPRPPLHWQCRSLRVAVLDGEMLGFRPAKASTEKQLLREFAAERNIGAVKSRDALPRGTKGAYDAFARKRIRELTGRVPSSTSYQEWLKKQSNNFQDDTLGITKAKLFRDGNLKLDKFVAADGSELTLAQLAVKEAQAFRAAGLNPQDFI